MNGDWTTVAKIMKIIKSNQQLETYKNYFYKQLFTVLNYNSITL